MRRRPAHQRRRPFGLALRLRTGPFEGAAVSAILWRHQNGAAWRAIPAELGPWWLAAQIVIRWARAGVWERLLDRVQNRGVALGMVFLDGTNIRAHQKAAGAAKRGDLEPSETNVKLLAARVAAMAPRPV
jgi:transposase